MGSLKLLTPKALWLLALLVPLVVLYILKVRRQQRRIGSTWLWKGAQRDLMASSPFKKLIVQLPLILQALAIIALAFTASQLTSLGEGESGDHVAIVIDTSASMAAVDPTTGETRIAQARQAARERIEALPPGSDAMLLEAGRDARVVLPPDRDRRRLEAALDEIRVRHVEGDLASAIALAAGRLKQVGGDRKIVVLSDGNLAKPAPLASRGPIPIELARVGAPIDNAAIIRVDVRSGRDNSSTRDQVQAFLLLANFGKTQRDVYVTMRRAETPEVLASRRVTLEPGAREPVVLTFEPTRADEGTPLVFEMTPRDALSIDDVAYGRVPPGRSLPVVVASAGKNSPWLERVLRADTDVTLTTMSVTALEKARDGDHAALPSDAFMVVDGACPTGIPGGDILIVNPPRGECYGTTVGEQLDKPLITSWAQSDPRMRFLTLDRVTIAVANSLTPASRQQELVRSDRGVLVTDISTARRTATLIGFDVGESNWPLRRSYVLFMRNLLEEARLHRSAGILGSATAGRPLRVALPVGVEEVLLRAPGMQHDVDAKPLAVRNGIAIVADAQTTGHYRLSWTTPQPGERIVPVNLTSSAESDLQREPTQTDKGALAVSDAGDKPQRRRDYSWLLALLALLLIAADVWWQTRKPRAVSLGSGKPRLPSRRPTKARGA